MPSHAAAFAAGPGRLFGLAATRAVPAPAGVLAQIAGPTAIAFQMRTPIWCLGQASQVGDAFREVIDQLLEVNALYRLRAAQGVLGLRKKYGDARLEAACRKAITVGDPSYRTVKGIMVAGTEADPEPETGDAGAAAFLHGPEGLFAATVPAQSSGDGQDDQDRGDAEGAIR